MADFEGSAALTQAAASLSASGDTVNPGGTQAAGTLLASGNVINTGTAALSQAAATLSASGYSYDFAGTAAVTQGAATMAATGNTGPAVQSAMVQSGQWVAASGGIFAAGSVSPGTLSAQQAVATRRDIQLPRIPTSVSKDAQDWFLAAQKIFDKYLFGSDGNRLVSINDLSKAGIADRNGSTVIPPQGNLTTPPKVVNMRADGALASIIIQWQNPVFRNYSHTELWRASVDDLGQAVKIQETPVESYVDMVGSGATKYYWARAVSTAGVKGDFNSASGTVGQTGFDPTYVRDIMTSAVWKPVTVFAAYQYVRPTTPNGYQYACIDGGRTAGVEPTWPTTVGNTVVDGGVEWQCVAADSRVPFVIGTDPGGNPAVFIDTAYIEDATITSAKIGDLVADKITTGDLNANLHVLSKIWSGFDEYANPGSDSGFWIGVDGGVPRFHLNTGASGGNRYLKFTGSDIEMNVDILSGADVSADDLFADSATLTRAEIGMLSVVSFVTPSDWVDEAVPPIGADDPAYENFLCYASGCRKTAELGSYGPIIVGTGYSRPYAYFMSGYYSGVVPYNHADSATKYRAKSKAIALRIRISVQGAASVPGGASFMTVYIMNQTQAFSSTAYNASDTTTGIPSTYLCKMALTGVGDEVQAVTNTGSGDTNTFIAAVDTVGDDLLITIEDDEETLNYVDGQSLRVGVVYKLDWEAGSSDDDTIYGVFSVSMQIDTLLQLDVADNDPSLGE